MSKKLAWAIIFYMVCLFVTAVALGWLIVNGGKPHRSDPAPKPSDTRSALYVKAAPPAAQHAGFVCQNEVNNEMPSGWEPICYPAS